jgi:uncharacterized protein (TIGR03000 family)
MAGWGSGGGSYGTYYGGSSGGSYGTYYGGSSGHRPFTPVRSVLRGIHNHMVAKVERHRARRAAYGSSGYVTSYGSSGYSTSYGSSGYSTSYGSSGYSTSYGSTGSYGTSYGSTGGYETSYGSTGSYGTSYGSTGGYETSYGSTGVSYGSTGHVSNVVVDPSVSFASSTTTIDDAVYLTVSVPSAAKVYVNDKLTSSTGTVRQFVSRGLAAGKNYKFEIRAELDTADGQTIKEEKSLVVSAGSDEQLQFAFAETNAKIQTSLTLNVPEGAKVTLAGNPTKATGSQRVFLSSQLKVGETWDDYSVEVELEGKVKRQAIRLIGGDQLALSFDFEEPKDQLASK